MLIETAGIRNTDDTVEKIGVEKSIKSIEKADLVVVMIDGSGFFGDEDVEVDVYKRQLKTCRVVTEKYGNENHRNRIET